MFKSEIFLLTFRKNPQKNLPSPGGREGVKKLKTKKKTFQSNKDGPFGKL